MGETRIEIRVPVHKTYILYTFN